MHAPNTGAGGRGSSEAEEAEEGKGEEEEGKKRDKDGKRGWRFWLGPCRVCQLPKCGGETVLKSGPDFF